MLTITIPGVDGWDEATEKFVSIGDVTVDLEHSLVSLSKWESITEKPFLTTQEKTTDEIKLYLSCMCLTPEISPEVFSRATFENVEEINKYLGRKMTATTFHDIDAKTNREIITSELIYYWMVALQIPFECQHWHLNRLLTLIKVTNLKNQPPKKMTGAEIAARQRALNAQRQKEMGTRG